MPGKVWHYLSPMPCITSSGSLGAVLVQGELLGWYLRGVDLQGMRAGNTVPSLVRLPPEVKAAMRAVGNIEPPRMAQAVARSVIGPWVERASSRPPGECPRETPWRRVNLLSSMSFQQLSKGPVPELATAKAVASRARPRLKNSLPFHQGEDRPVSRALARFRASRGECGSSPCGRASVVGQPQLAMLLDKQRDRVKAKSFGVQPGPPKSLREPELEVKQGAECHSGFARRAPAWAPGPPRRPASAGAGAAERQWGTKYGPKPNWEDHAEVGGCQG